VASSQEVSSTSLISDFFCDNVVHINGCIQRQCESLLLIMEDDCNLKAVLVGINYGDRVFGCQDLEESPHRCVEKMALALTSNSGSWKTYKKEECLMLMDSDKGIEGINKDEPTKTRVTKSLVDLVTAAKEGDSLLFYFCGLARNIKEKGKSCGILLTLNDALNAPDAIYGTELDNIFKNLPSDASISILVHVCGKETEFTYRPESVRGAVLVSIGPLCPLMVTKGHKIADFSTAISKDDDML